MADQKISQLPTITGANMADDDKFVLVDTSGDATVATTRAEFFKSVPEVTFGDGIKAKFGNGSDLQISHDGNNSIIDEVGTGNLFIRATNINFQNRDSNPTEQMITAVANGAVTLNHNGSPKIATSSTGINVTGTVTSDGLTVDKAGSSAALFKGFSSATNISSASNGEIALGQSTSFQGRISYDGQGAGVLYVENTYNNNAADIIFRAKSSGTAQNKLKIDGNGDISFYEDTGTTAKFFWDSSAESLGIGTSSPDSVLHLQKSDATAYSATATDGQVGVGPTIYLENPANSNATVGGQIVFGMRSTEEQARISATGGTAPALTFGTGDAEAMRIDSSGNVGIGTDDPSATLEVTGNTLVSNDGTDDFIKQSVSGTTSTLAFGNTEATGGTAKWSYNRGTGILSGNIGASAGTNFMTVNGSGKVGISQPAPVALLHVGDGTNVLGTTSGNSLSNFTLQTDTTNVDSLAFTTRRTADGADWTTARHRIQRKVDAVLMGYMDFGHNTSSLITFGEANSEYARIDGGGAFHVGRTTNDFTDAGFSANSSGLTSITRSDNVVLLLNRHTDNNGEIVQFKRNNVKVGSINVQTGATSYLTSSDYRLKTDAQSMTGASERVQALNPVNFEWIADGSRVDGFLAHEAQEVVPEAVSGERDAMMDEEYEITPAVLDEDGFEVVTEAVMGTRSVPDYQGIDQSKLVPLLTAALQEALAEIASLKTRVEALEG